MKKSIFGLIAFLIFSTQALAAPSIKIYGLQQPLLSKHL